MKNLKIFKNSILALSLAFTAASLQSCSETQANPTLSETPVLNGFVAEIMEPADIDGMTLDRSAFCTGIEKHEPAGEATSFSNDVGRVYLFTKISMEKGTTGHIRHVWSYKGKEYSNVRLSVKGPSFRTHSYKTIPSTMGGDWKVEVQTDDGTILSTLEVTVEKAATQGGI